MDDELEKILANIKGGKRKKVVKKEKKTNMQRAVRSKTTDIAYSIPYSTEYESVSNERMVDYNSYQSWRPYEISEMRLKNHATFDNYVNSSSDNDNKDL